MPPRFLPGVAVNLFLRSDRSPRERLFRAEVLNLPETFPRDYRGVNTRPVDEIFNSILHRSFEHYGTFRKGTCTDNKLISGI